MKYVLTDAGTYKVVINVAESNEDYFGTKEVEFTIAKAIYDGTKTASGTLKAEATRTVEITLPAIPTGASYGDATKTVAGDKYTLSAITSGKITATSTGIADGTTDMTFTVAVDGGTNYEDYDITVTITPKYKEEVTINATAMIKSSKQIKSNTFKYFLVKTKNDSITLNTVII